MNNCLRSPLVRVLLFLALGFLLQLAIPVSLSKLGFADATLWAIWPGLLPVLWLTGGWFAGLGPGGLAILIVVNTIVYASLCMAMVRLVRCGSVILDRL